MRRRRFLGLAAGFGLAACLSARVGLAPAADRRRTGGACDGCEAIYDGLPSALSSTVRLTPEAEPGERMEISGFVYRVDGRTPAPGVILYLWQTNAQGLYVPGPCQRGAAASHGSLRGWLRSGSRGEYAFSTIRPAPYPQGDLPAHVHVVVKEPDRNEYYLDDFLFDDDPLLTAAKRAVLENRGGSGIMRLKKDNGRWLGRRDLVLGRHIPNY